MPIESDSIYDAPTTRTFPEQLRSWLDECGRDLATEEDARARCAEIVGALLGPLGGSPQASPQAAEPRLLRLPLQAGHSYAVVGDLHGDYAAFDDILRSFFPRDLSMLEASRRHVLLLGDLLDRGTRDFQLLHLVARLLRDHPAQFALIRGNHEELLFSDGVVKSAVKGDTDLFVNFFRDIAPAGFFEALVRYFERLPHLAILGGERGGVALVHAGVPPAFLLRKYPSEADWFEVENVRRAFLWGRGPIENRPRPDRPYPFDQFFSDDVRDFCERTGTKLVIRGHDVQAKGASVSAGGRCLTVFSTGTTRDRPNADSAFDGDVDLPRFVVLDADRLFRGGERGGELVGLDNGVDVREIFTRDLVLLVEDSRSGFGRFAEPLARLARAIHDEILASHDVGLHVLERGGYSTARAAVIDVWAPRRAAFDPNLEAGAQSRIAFVLRCTEVDTFLWRWRPGATRGVPDEALRLSGGSEEKFARRCAGFIRREAELRALPAPASPSSGG